MRHFLPRAPAATARAWFRVSGTLHHHKLMKHIKSPASCGKYIYYRVHLSFETPQAANAFKHLQKFFAQTYNVNGSEAALKALQEFKGTPHFQEQADSQDIREIKINTGIIRQILESNFP
jgi:hypothetical protein